MRRRLGWIGLLVVGVALTSTASARADAWRPVAQSCVSAAGTNGACTTVRAGGGLWQAAVAPGGTHAYGITYDAHSLLIFDRNPATGQLTQRGAGGCLSESGTSGQCLKAKGLMQANRIAISPDGRNVYVASQGPGVVSTFDRNVVSGDLTQKPGLDGCISQDGSSAGVAGLCRDGRGLTSAGTLAISPDGRTLYAGTGPIAVLQRDPATGVLSQPAGEAGCVDENQADGCAKGRGLNISRQPAVSPDGRSVYFPGNRSNTLTVFDRDPNSGLIQQKSGLAGCFGQTSLGGQCTVEPKLGKVLAVLPSPDGRQVYVSVADGMLVYSRAADGRLTLQSCINDAGTGGCATGPMLRFVSYSAMSPDGQTIVAGLESDPGIVIFRRDPATGNLTQPASKDACVTITGAAYFRGAQVPDRCFSHPALFADGQMTFVDDRSFIAGAYFGSALVSFKRDFYPTCRNTAVNVSAGVATPAPLSCADRNGDPLSYEIRANPVSGVLGAIDRANARIFYSPFSGFLGGDSFAYRASANGLPSADATVSVNVVAPTGGSNPPPTKHPTIASGASWEWSVRGSKHTLKSMTIRSLPAKATVTFACSGAKCPFKTRRIKRGAKSTLNVIPGLKGKRTFRAKQTLDVRIAAPGYNTKVLRFKLVARKIPKSQAFCIPLGGKKLQRTC